MLELHNITLIAMTGKNFEGHAKAIEKSCEAIEWGAVKLIERPDLDTIDKWNYAMVYDLWTYVDTQFAMVIHADGYVINPECWNDEFLQYDYVGAPWPLPKDRYSYRDQFGKIQRVGNSVSLRSRKLMKLPTDLDLEWRSFYGNTNEDGYLCVHKRHILEKHGCTFAPLEVAVHFSKEHEIPENEGIKTFAFHQVDL